MANKSQELKEKVKHGQSQKKKRTGKKRGKKRDKKNTPSTPAHSFINKENLRKTKVRVAFWSEIGVWGCQIRN